MSSVDSLEKTLGDAFKGAPKLPQGGKKALVQWLPWINLVLGILSLWTAYALWHWAHLANTLIDYANSLSRSLGGVGVVTHRLSFGIWLGIIVLIIEGLFYLAAFPGTRDHKKAGWDLMFYALLVNAVYGVVILFTNYGGVGNLIGYLIGTVIGLYLLFQIRDSYGAAKSAAKK
jgi:hypothetical protein